MCSTGETFVMESYKKISFRAPDVLYQLAVGSVVLTGLCALGALLGYLRR